MNIKYSFSDVKKIFEEANCTLISNSDEYKSTRSKMTFKCPSCEEVSSMYFSTFVNGKPKMCSKCRVKNRKFSRVTNTRYDQSSVEKIYLDHGCLFLGEYTLNDKRYEFVCKCGEIDEKLFYQFQKTPMCRHCSKKIASVLRMNKYEDVEKYFNSLGCKLISTEYTGVSDPLDYICVNGHRSSASFDAVRVSANGKCTTCRVEAISGENNYRWKGGIYGEGSKKFRSTYEFKEWRKGVFARDGFKCKCCGNGGTLNAHHIDGYNWCIEKRTDIDNGITLCEDCHSDFHIKYGYGDNTRIQLEEFLAKRP